MWGEREREGGRGGRGVLLYSVIHPAGILREAEPSRAELIMQGP